MTETSMNRSDCNARAGDGTEVSRTRLPLALSFGFNSTQDVGACHTGKHDSAVHQRRTHAGKLRSVEDRHTNMKERFYGIDKAFERSMRLLDRAPIGEVNRELIRKFLSQLSAEGCGKLRVMKYNSHLRVLAQTFAIDFPCATKDDVIRVFADIEQRPLSADTKLDYRVFCRRFFTWLRKTDGYPEEVRWLKGSLGKVDRKLPEDMLSVDEVKRLASAAVHVRDRALILVLYESGCRVGEIGGLHIGSIKFDDFGAIITVTGKTGMRRVRLVGSAPALAAWLEVHPAASIASSPLWVGIGPTVRGEPMSYSAISRILKCLAKKAEIKKRVHAHLFRHSRATELAALLTESQLREVFGWTQSSTQPGTYVHLSGRNVDEAILRINGIRVGGEDEAPPLKPLVCGRCGTHNENIAKFCRRCGQPLSDTALAQFGDERNQWDDVMSELLADSDVQHLLAKKIGQLKLQLPSGSR